MKKLRKHIEWALLIILFGGILFYSNSNFVEKELLPKEYVFIILTLILGYISLILNHLPLQLNRLIIVLVLWVLYLTSISIFNSPSAVGPLSSIGFLFLFFFFKHTHTFSKTINILIIGLCILQACYGLLQYFHLTHSISFFPIIGSYDNPAGFAACLSVAFPLIFSLFGHQNKYQLLAIIAIICIGGAIVLSESRTGIISITTASLIFTYNKQQRRLKKHKKYIFPIFSTIGLAIFLTLLLVKQDSVSGRFLIWQRTYDMIKDKPILGGGDGSFRSNYMNYQANYFIQNTKSEYALLADNVSHPFNEYLLLIANFGIVGIIPLIAIFILLFKLSNIWSPYMLCLISLGVFSLFSYPLKYPFTWVISAYCLAQISSNSRPIIKFKFTTRTWFKSSIGLLAIIGLICISKDIIFEYNWNKVAKYALLGKAKKVMPEYEKLYHSWNGNYLFLYNYGAVLNHLKEYAKSLEILDQCTLYWNDYDIQLIIADNYFNLEDWTKAEQHYKLASNMCPNRFIPLYKLHEIYKVKKEYHKAEEMAKKILKKNIKVPSETVNSIVTNMKIYLNKTTRK